MAAQYLVFIVNFQWPRKQITKTQPWKGWKKPRTASVTGIPVQERGLGQYVCLFQVCVRTDAGSRVPCCPWLALQPFTQFLFQTHLLPHVLPRTGRSRLPIGITSFNSFIPNTPTHLCRMGSAFHILQGFCLGLHSFQKNKAEA